MKNPGKEFIEFDEFIYSLCKPTQIFSCKHRSMLSCTRGRSGQVHL
jgi:hypothetical protein